MFQAKIERRGDQVALIVSDQVLARLQAGSAEVLYFTDAPDGSLRLSNLTPEVARQVAAGLEVVEQYDEALRALAK